MTTTARSTALVMIQPAFTDAERLALAGFLAGYRGLTREAYALDLRQFTTWCRARSLGLFAVRRADIESFARELEARGRARATVTRRLCTIARFYRYAVEEELLDHSPARPRKVRSGKNRSRSPSRGSGSARLAPHQSSASAARRRNTSPGKVLSRGAGAQARSATRRCLRRGPARRAGSGGRSRCPQGWAASLQACHDGKAEPPAGRPLAADARCRPVQHSDVTRSPRFVVALWAAPRT